MVLLKGNLSSSTSPCMIPACFPGVFNEAAGLPPARLEKYSLCEKSLDEGFGVGRGRSASTLACEKEYWSGKVPWKWVSIIAAADRLVYREAQRPHAAMGGMSPQELAVPSCTANVTVQSRSQAGRLTQPLCSQPPLAWIRCAQPHTHSPFLVGLGGEEGNMWPTAPHG